MYVFAGLAKLNTDWLAARAAVAHRGSRPAPTSRSSGHWLDEPWVAHGLSWSGAAFDLLVVPALCWRRTRPYAWAAIVVFHVVDVAAVPDRRVPVGDDRGVDGVLRARLAGTPARAPAATPARDRMPPVAPSDRRRTASACRAAARRASASCGSRCRSRVPLRHWVVPGDYRWTNEGYRFAWVVLLTEKGGDVSFRVREPATGRQWIETAQDLYTPNQWRAMTTEPELIRQAAHASPNARPNAAATVEVRADAFVRSTAGRRSRLVDPAVDLAREPWRIHQPWILPLPTSSPY